MPRASPANTTRGDYIEDALTEEEAAQGFALACQMRPKTDLVIKIAASSEVCKTKGQNFNARLNAVERLSPTTIAFSLSLDGGDGLGFLPGQYVNILVPGTDQRRSYSFSSPPGRQTLVIPGPRHPARRDEQLPARERQARAHAMEFIGPAGSFYLREIKRPLLFLAGGTGLAPFLSMLGRIAETGSAHPVHLIYGVTNDEDLVGIEQLEAFAERIPDFTFSMLRRGRGQRLSAKRLCHRATSNPRT